ncbi:MAG: hypothetical protein AVDCRST_MAG68-3631 [uncultured Gemmatimonadetes bacterium]|uniref:Uncharacterized protein n=1 Tax=uncultured Gemmatimonadota bacterium TaxID=203437 RepID=A0A6J4M504_9BACT|nr:MAG: hypothetical protein AVDCRST_MAG68-3631 [uncultured Gemmatimonadota bacterium]
MWGAAGAGNGDQDSIVRGSPGGNGNCLGHTETQRHRGGCGA